MTCNPILKRLNTNESQTRSSKNLRISKDKFKTINRYTITTIQFTIGNWKKGVHRIHHQYGTKMMHQHQERTDLISNFSLVLNEYPIPCVKSLIHTNKFIYYTYFPHLQKRKTFFHKQMYLRH